MQQLTSFLFIALLSIVCGQLAAQNYVELPGHKLMVQKKDLGEGTWDVANTICNNSTTGGFDDWRLPTLDEFTILYRNRNEIGGFVTTTVTDKEIFYWSSTAYKDSSHWSQSFSSGTQITSANTAANNCRCVRDY